MTGPLILMQSEEYKIDKDHYRHASSHEQSITKSNFIDKKYSIWPDNNLYLRVGIYSKLIERHYNHLSCDLIFVDFSHYNIKLFSDSQWIDKLAKTGTGLILVSDYKMDNYASYWWKNNHNIATVIYSSDSKYTIRRKIKDVFIGRWRKDIKSRSLTSLEADVLNLLIKEYSVKDIAEYLGLDRKKLYNTKYSLQRKLSGEINKLFLSCSVS